MKHMDKSGHNIDTAISIPEFCRRFGISTPTYYSIRAKGRGPREVRIAGSVVRITPEAICDWLADAQDEEKTADQRARMKARSKYALSGGR
ncbi:hypothetical protein EJ074_27970 [Mesorhizobium sp. M3A.F.Ca.ET.080.04.2.1]|uniref:helix-turn-helix transcriptional regulator n=1 Tax=Mesorhizobium sp. M3A.F.Ca.ET.080.04.2.1 TaxID=2493676 RepID=UPI000F764B3A|nr:hypothetical protein [Mesorhizobium sp. M3A.F.Ca.ET.080.04.2.1]AZO12533.1 hypothetical protein EJ074_27970 [Mesorhizobium sp. M3A.F.Ca.ET.080.04.2.1]RWF26442.1 MAG: hypothetical protein EOS64_01400 [Mesorhizobium sp.]